MSIFTEYTSSIQCINVAYLDRDKMYKKVKKYKVLNHAIPLSPNPFVVPLKLCIIIGIMYNVGKKEYNF